MKNTLKDLARYVVYILMFVSGTINLHDAQQDFRDGSWGSFAFNVFFVILQFDIVFNDSLADVWFFKKEE